LCYWRRLVEVQVLRTMHQLYLCHEHGQRIPYPISPSTIPINTFFLCFLERANVLNTTKLEHQLKRIISTPVPFNIWKMSNIGSQERSVSLFHNFENGLLRTTGSSSHCNCTYRVQVRSTSTTVCSFTDSSVLVLGT
jgi:hypothetical protein